MLRDMYDEYNAAMGNPIQQGFNWDTATMDDIDNFPQEFKDKIDDSKEKGKQVNKSDIQELKRLQNPPEAVRKVCSAAALMLANENDYKTFLSMSNHPDKILKLIKSQEPLAMTKEQTKLLDKSKDDPDFDPEFLSSKNSACVPIARWLKSLQQLQELRNKLRKAENDAKKPKLNKALSGQISEINGTVLDGATLGVNES